MSIKKEILEILNTPKYYYKGVPVNAFFLPALGGYKKESVRNNFYYLKSRIFNPFPFKKLNRKKTTLKKIKNAIELKSITGCR